MLNLVITMAGKGSRFLSAGYNSPKYELLAHDKTLFEWSISSIKNFINKDTRLVFVCLKENSSVDFIREKMKDYIFLEMQIIELDNITDGQASSAFSSHLFWDMESPLIIFNIDTHINPVFLKPENIPSGSDGWIPCFNGSGSHWSFVQLDINGWAVNVIEKMRISNYASVGLYWFLEARDFFEAYKNNKKRLQVLGESYVAPLYNYLIGNKKRISITEIPTAEVVVLGTPLEFEDFKNNNNSNLINLQSY